jgi:cytochrome b
MKAQQIRVWDPFVRLFHWTLVAAFFIAYVTEEDFLTLHIWAGYIVLGFIVARILWGFVGPQYARFSSFVFSPRNIIAFLKDTVAFKAKRYLGHNPAGGAMILLLILSLILTTVTGIAIYGVEENAGPLAVLGSAGEFWEEVFEETHEFFANFTVFLVVIHITGVILESFLHRENLVRAMIDGNKRAEETDATEQGA